jgi:hypothetical protein
VRGWHSSKPASVSMSNDHVMSSAQLIVLGTPGREHDLQNFRL